MLHRPFVPHHQPPVVVHPSEAPLDFPALAIARAGADRTSMSRALAVSARERGNRGFDTPPPQSATEGPAVIHLVRHQLLRACPRTTAWLWDTSRCQGGFRQSALVGLGARAMQPDGQAMAVGHDHHLAALADFRFPDGPTPFSPAQSCRPGRLWSTQVCAGHPTGSKARATRAPRSRPAPTPADGASLWWGLCQISRQTGFLGLDVKASSPRVASKNERL
jgi:hypothetical protein